MNAPKSSPVLSVVSDDSEPSSSEREAAPSSVPTGPKHVLSVMATLAVYMPGRADVIRAVFIAAIAREFALLVGPPGTAKSMLARGVSRVFALRHFEHLMTRFTPPEEILGPPKLTALAQDRLERATAGYLPTAESCFLDEVFKANSAILNSLLGVLADRALTDGGKVHKLPLLTGIGASNEVPDPDEGLDAIYDRFLVRVDVPYLTSPADRAAMLVGGPLPAVLPRIDLRAEQIMAHQVRVTDETVEAIVKLQDALADRGVRSSDRRWKQSLALVRVSAYLDGRAETDPEQDLEVLAYSIGTPAQATIVREQIAKSVNPSGAKASERARVAKELLASVPVLGSNPTADHARTIQDAIGRVAPEIKAIVADIAAMPSGRATSTAQKTVDAVLVELRERAQACFAVIAGSI